ncbi:hypothetical protein [Actinophytocola sp.]|uniref:hypothetical protein n=1 Tax=Actinophytocola sp. TaxID=1872138 RepID=UPI002D7E9A4A|nr:hypothetical protein [Actinophytocola sp.]HET9140899.1 hypothetical protein [Actinophytocola sp.]
MTDLGAQAVVGRGTRASVVGLCLVAATALINPYLVRNLGGTSVLVGSFAEPGIGNPEFVPMVVGAGLGILVSLLVLRLAPAAGWIALLVVGTAFALLAELSFVDTFERDMSTTEFIGSAAAALVTFGLLGAGGWLLHAAGVGAAAPVIATPFVAPLLAFALVAVMIGNRGSLQPTGVTLGVVGLVAAAALVALVPVVRRAAADPPAWRVSVVGAFAALLVLAPRLLALSGAIDPYDTASTRALSQGLAGVLIFFAALGLTAALGIRPLVAALGIALVTYGATVAVNLLSTNLPVPVAGPASLRSIADVVACLLGVGLGAAAAHARWLPWCAGAACAVTAVVTTAMTVLADPQPTLVPEALRFVLLVLVVFALVTAVAGAAGAIGAGALVPVVLGLCAGAMLTGMEGANAVVLNRTAVATLGVQTWFILLGVVAGCVLLVGGALILVLHRFNGRVASGVEHQQ